MSVYNIISRIKNSFFTILFSFCFFYSFAQKAPEKNWNSARILHEINKLKHVGRVLYVAAHPDDENTQLISYLSNVMGLETAYLSLTRGDGGQDLIGPQVREELGVIRTQELLMARSVDGGQQFFTRANDFGFSKTAKETLRIWDSNEVESDMVWIIRKFKPDIIITRFSPTYSKTHGHHQASAMLAMKAFDDAANPNKFPEQLKYVEPWQATSLFWNTSLFFFQDKDHPLDTASLYHTSIDSYLPLLGKSVADLAAESRSMHKSQGMGTSPRRGDLTEYFVYLKGKKPENRDIFSVANFDWSRINGGNKINDKIDDVIRYYSFEQPEKCLQELAVLHNALEPLDSNYLVKSKLQQVENIILQCRGIYTEAVSNKEYLTPGDSINVSLNAIEQREGPGFGFAINADLLIDGKKICSLSGDSKNPLPESSYQTYKANCLLPDDLRITGPYWLEEDPAVGMYKVDEQLFRGLPQNPQQVAVRVSYRLLSSLKLEIKPITITRDIPVFYKTVDPVKGEQYSLARIVPPAVANPDTKLMVFTDNRPKTLTIKVKSFEKGTYELHVNLPNGWTTGAKPPDILTNWNSLYSSSGGGEEHVFSCPISLQDGTNSSSGNIDITIEKDGHTYNRSMEEINYDHIPKQVLLPKSQVKVEKIDIKTSNKLIGYINGAGDDIPQCLKEIGYKVETIAPEQLASIDLSKYNTIIAGVRAYNTVNRLKYDNQRLLDYVRNGGTYIVQYNNSFRLETDKIGPYPLTLSSDRTTEEDAKVTFVHPDNTVLNTPNKITDADFNGWVQERGLYYPNKWDTANYIPILQMGDSGEKPSQGALLVAKYGKGYFEYTGLSFFRELPAGVSGAYRLFANLIELGSHGTK